MKKERRTESLILNILRKKRDVKIEENRVLILTDKDEKGNPNPNKRWDLGIKSWGHIEYLMKVHKYSIGRVTKFA